MSTMAMPINRAETLLEILDRAESTPVLAIEHLKYAIYDAEAASICNDVFIELDSTYGRYLQQVADTNHVYHVII